MDQILKTTMTHIQKQQKNYTKPPLFEYIVQNIYIILLMIVITCILAGLIMLIFIALTGHIDIIELLMPTMRVIMIIEIVIGVSIYKITDATYNSRPDWENLVEILPNKSASFETYRHETIIINDPTTEQDVPIATINTENGEYDTTTVDGKRYQSLLNLIMDKFENTDILHDLSIRRVDGEYYTEVYYKDKYYKFKTNTSNTDVTSVELK